MSHECGIIVIKYFLIKYANKIKKNEINYFDLILKIHF